MPDPQPDKTASAGIAGGEIKCARCGTANPREGRRCRECQSHLYLRCPHCDARTDRSLETCAACGKRLETPFFKRLRHQLKSKRAKRFYRMARLVFSAAVILFLIVLGFYFSMHFDQ